MPSIVALLRWIGMRPPRVALVAFALALGSPAAARADALTISLLTFGPGDHPFSKFGHNGLLVEDHERGTSLVYNYGTFAFDSIGLIPKFLLGKYRYWLSVQGLGQTLATYSAENRSVVAQKLELTEEQKQSMVAFLEWNAKDENKYYLFDYYRDNCATRLRDLIDKTTGGSISRTAKSPAEFTWRGHTARLTADDVPVFLGLYVAMGSLIDRPITQWEEMFLPAKLAEGVERAGIAEEGRVLVAARRPPPRAAPPAWTAQALVLGAAVGGALTWLGRAAGRGIRAAGVGLRVSLGIIGSLAGLLGSILLFLWIFTNHEVTYHNENILQCAPFALLLAGHRSRWHVVLAALACSALGLALKALPWFSQDNSLVIAFALPVWTGAAAATYLAERTRASLLPASRAGSNDDKSSRGETGGDPSETSPRASASDATSASAAAPSRR
jgi:hypothetical protein